MKLTNTVTNITKNNKGFSLLEVLVGVAIIGIISAIAVPTYTNYRNNAAKVASDTSAGNIAKAYQNCLVLNSFSSCKSLGQLNIDCPGGSDCHSGGISGKFCADVWKGTAPAYDFKVCVAIDASGQESRTYGGDLINYSICNEKCGVDAKSAIPGAIKCTSATDCGTGTPPCTDSVNTLNATKTFTCDPVLTGAGNCAITTGVCS